MAKECCVDIDEPSSPNNMVGIFIDIYLRGAYDRFKDNPFFIRQEEAFQVERDLKLKLVKNFIDLFNKDKTEDDLVDVIWELKELIEMDDTNNDDPHMLGQIFFLNGYATLQFIHSYVNKKLEEFEIGTVQRREMRDKVFEWTLPFRALELLVDLTNDPDQLKTDVVKFIHINNIIKVSQFHVISYANSLAQWENIVKIIRDQDQDPHVVVDLRYLLYLLITSPNGHIVSANINGKNEEDTHRHVLCIPFFCWKRPKSRDPVATGYDIIDNDGFFRNVEELKSAGIEFEPSGWSLADISFSNSYFDLKGHLKLPPLIMDERTSKKLERLAKYEQDIDDKRCVVTSYLKFMDILIDSEQDVKELRASRILQNRLSSDKNVADWINKCGSELREPPQDFHSGVKTQIQTHCGRKGAVWMNQVYRQHFSSPWAIIGLLAAVMILSLTAIQTVFAINPKK